MNTKNRVLYDKKYLPIRVGDLCALLHQNARLENVDPDTMITCFASRSVYKPFRKGFLLFGDSNDAFSIKQMHEGGAAVLADHAIDGVPCIVVDDIRAAFHSISTWMYEAINLPAVVVTGSVGKTTTKRMIGSVLEEKNPVFNTNKNRNLLREMCCYLQDVQVGDQMVMWELCENLPRDHAFCANVLKPSVAVITNIGESHLGSIKGGKEGQLEIFRRLPEEMDKNGVVVINADDPDSAGLRLDRETIRIGIHDAAADCVARNIINTQKGVEFDLCFRDETTRVKLSVFGEQNVYDAMMAFVVGVLQGVDKKDILKGLKSYRNIGIRQNVIRIGNEIVYVDCYNASATSDTYAIRCFSELPEVRGKRIAVLGDIAEIEGFEEDTYRKIAEAVDRSTIDALVTYGQNSYMIQDYVARSIRMTHCETAADLNRCLAELRHSGKNAYLLKGSRTMFLERNMKAVFPAHYHLMRFMEILTIKFRWKE